MSIFVDDLRKCLKNNRWRWSENCHLVGDDMNELHAFALRIGLKRSWFQNGSSIPHYDLTANKRRLAVLDGAIEITGKELVQMIQDRREKKITNY